MQRRDRRSFDQFRDISIVYEGLDRVDGSARFGFGQTQSLVSVSGPIEVRPLSELPSQATLDITVRPLASVPGTDSKAVASTLKSILSPTLLLSHNPRSLIQIVGQALCGNESGSGTGSSGRGWNASLVASLINATSAALINAGSIPMKGVVCAVAVGRISGVGKTTQLILDPSEAELSELSGSGSFAFFFSSTLGSSGSKTGSDIPSCSLIWTNYSSLGSTSFDESELSGAQQLAEKGAVDIWKQLKQSVGSMGKRTPPTKRVDEVVVGAEDSEPEEEKMEI
ncbi:RNase PH family protein [Abortiporus biennis]